MRLQKYSRRPKTLLTKWSFIHMSGSEDENVVERRCLDFHLRLSYLQRAKYDNKH